MLQSLLALKDKTPVDYDKPILEVNLPPKLTEFPRQKPIPKDKPLTKWERFKQLKGLRPRKKRSRFVFDEITKAWVPRYGFKSIKHIQDEATGIIEDKEGIPLAESNPFEERKIEKKLEIEKQKMREIKNKIAATRNQKAKEDISETLKIAQRSTASMGKHDKKASKKEPESKPQKEKINVSKWDIKQERKRNLNIFLNIP